MIRLAIPLVLILTALSGCADAGVDMAIIGQGTTSGTKNDSAECGTSGELSYALQGTGSVRLTLKDADGKVILDQTTNINGQEAKSSSVKGAAGTWTLDAKFGGGSSSYYSSTEFQGQWAIKVSC